MAYQLGGSFSADNIPENIKGSLAQSALEIYGLMQVSNSIQIVEGQLNVAYQIGKNTKFFKLPLVRKDMDKKDRIIAELKKENQRKQVTF